MALSLLTNMASLEAQRNVNITQSSLATSVERLSSGMRINHASDDAAGLAISSKLTAELKGLKQASRNANDAISMIQTAEGGLGEVNNLLSRMRELAIEAANGGTVGNSERGAIDTEFQALKSEITRIVNVTTYNGQALLQGGASAGLSFQVGAFNTSNDHVVLTISSIDISQLSISSSDVTSQTSSQDAIGALDDAIESIAITRANIGASQNRLVTTVDNLSISYNNLSAANGRILDTDISEESANLTAKNILLQAGVSVLAQANSQPQVIMQLLRG